MKSTLRLTIAAFGLVIFHLSTGLVKAGDYTYTTNNGTITITKYTGPGGAVAIPDTITGLPVTSIGDRAFANSTSLTCVVIPIGVTSIGSGAFCGCTRLTGVEIGENVTSIGGSAFSGTSLTCVTIPNSVTNVWNYAFAFCASLMSVTIGNGVTTICSNAFDSCTRLASVSIPDSVIGIQGFAFSRCSSLKSVTIGNSASYIGDFAFRGCSRLTEVQIGRSVSSIGPNVFRDCPSLTSIAVDPLNTFYSSVDGVLLNKAQTALIQYPACKAGSRYTIPDGVSGIWSWAFAHCTTLTSVTIPGSVAGIGYEAFSGCTNLAAVFFKGNAPGYGGLVFHLDDNAVVYYLPGTTGWEATFGGIPTALWMPQIQTGDAGFGVEANRFGFNINWTAGRTVVVEACTDLANPSWIRLQTNTFAEDSWDYSDAEWTNYPSRFYRIRSQ